MRLCISNKSRDESIDRYRYSGSKVRHNFITDGYGDKRAFKRKASTLTVASPHKDNTSANYPDYQNTSGDFGR